MPNSPLRQAMADAKMTVRGLASAVGVDEKTVARWLSYERIPHPRHRWAAAEALGVDEAVLWPEAVRSAVKTGPDREIVAVYTGRAAVPKSLWKGLITDTKQQLVFAGYTNYFLWLELPPLGPVLRRKIDQGVRVRFVVGDPDSEVTRQREQIEGVPLTVTTRIKVTLDELSKLHAAGVGVEARYSDRHIAMSVFQFDQDMLVCLHLANMLGHDSPTLHLRRRQDDGLFDRFARHLDYLWESGRDIFSPALTEAEQ